MERGRRHDHFLAKASATLDEHKRRFGKRVIYKGLATPIPYLAVAYTGYKSVESLQERLPKTSEEARPTGVLVVDSGAFVCGDTYAIGELGLYGFAVVLTQMINAVGSATRI
jgi:hypothetical protein